MTAHKPKFLLLVGIFVVGGMIMSATLRSTGQNASSLAPQGTIDKSQYPVADYEAPEPSDPQERALRRARGSRYNGRGSLETGGCLQQGPEPMDCLVMHQLPDSAWQPFPVSQSDVILIGQALDAHAYMSPDKWGVYSEFTLSISEVLKGNEKSAYPLNEPITVLREGGQVRYPSGKTILFAIANDGMPRIGAKYLCFLKRHEEENDYALMKAYELRGGSVYALDRINVFQKSEESQSPCGIYEGMDQTAFLKKVRDAMKGSSKTEGKECRD